MSGGRLKSFLYAFRGAGDLIRYQANVRIHLIAAAGVLLIGCWLGLSPVEWCLMALTVAFVLAAEAFNTALEYLTDLVSPDYHELAGKAKDAAAAGVLISAVGAVVLGLIIFLPKLVAIL